VFEEIAKVGNELKSLGGLLDNKRPVADVAVVLAYRDRWALKNQKHHEGFDCIKHLEAYYAPLRRLGLSVDVIDPEKAPIDGYKLVIAPSLHLVDEVVLDRLVAYVQAGGVLCLGARSGFKDEHNALLPSLQPGTVLGALLGAEVEEYYALAEPVTVSGVAGSGSADVWAEALRVKAEDVEVLLAYGPGNAWLAGKPAMISRKSGQGRIAYLGAWADEAIMDAVLQRMADEANVARTGFCAPVGVSVHELTGDDGSAFVLNNCTDEPASVSLPGPMRDVLAGTACEGECTLQAREVAVLVPA
jgi:beta-galactosidase